MPTQPSVRASSSDTLPILPPPNCCPNRTQGDPKRQKRCCKIKNGIFHTKGFRRDGLLLFFQFCDTFFAPLRHLLFTLLHRGSTLPLCLLHVCPKRSPVLIGASRDKNLNCVRQTTGFQSLFLLLKNLLQLLCLICTPTDSMDGIVLKCHRP